MEENSLADTETGWEYHSCHTVHLVFHPLPEREANVVVVAASRYSEYNLAESTGLQMQTPQFTYSQRETVTTVGSTHWEAARFHPEDHLCSRFLGEKKPSF